MKNPGMVVAAIVGLVLLFALARIVIGIVKGAANFVLALLVVAALVVLVVWMFAYAKKHR